MQPNEPSLRLYPDGWISHLRSVEFRVAEIQYRPPFALSRIQGKITHFLSFERLIEFVYSHSIILSQDFESGEWCAWDASETLIPELIYRPSFRYRSKVRKFKAKQFRIADCLGLPLPGIRCPSASRSSHRRKRRFGVRRDHVQAFSEAQEERMPRLTMRGKDKPSCWTKWRETDCSHSSWKENRQTRWRHL